MPLAAPRPCRVSLCPGLARGADAGGYCPEHQDRKRRPWTRSNNARRDGKKWSGHAWSKIRAAVLRRDGYLCRCPECVATGTVRPAEEVDHIIPLAAGGTDNADNLRAVSRDCHKRLNARQRE